jgi:uncharacterized protein
MPIDFLELRYVLQKSAAGRRQTARLRWVRNHWWRLFRIPASVHSIALGFSAGVFISFTPLIGFHLLLAATMAFLLRSNIVASAIGTLIGNPLTFPFIWLSSYKLGTVLLNDGSESVIHANSLDYGMVSDNMIRGFAAIFWPMMAGGFLLGVLAAITCYCLVYCSVTAFRNRRRRMRAPQG